MKRVLSVLGHTLRAEKTLFLVCSILAVLIVGGSTVVLDRSGFTFTCSGCLTSWRFPSHVVEQELV